MNEISMLKILKPDILINQGFSTCTFLHQENIKKFLEFNTFKPRKTKFS